MTALDCVTIVVNGVSHGFRIPIGETPRSIRERFLAERGFTRPAPFRWTMYYATRDNTRAQVMLDVRWQDHPEWPRTMFLYANVEPTLRTWFTCACGRRVQRSLWAAEIVEDADACMECTGEEIADMYRDGKAWARLKQEEAK